MLPCFIEQLERNKIPIFLLTIKDFASWLAEQSQLVNNWVKSNNFQGEGNTYLIVPDHHGVIFAVIVVVDNLQQLNIFGTLATTLPQHTYELQQVANDVYQTAAIAWGKGAYQFTRYKKGRENCATLFLPDTVDKQFIRHLLQSIYLVRDLINTPAQDMSPVQLAKAAKCLADEFSATYHAVIGEDLVGDNFPAIYAVGKGSINPPHVIELAWGNVTDPHLILVGKGVCFDSGGYDLKSSTHMRLMKKDMGGAAHVLGLASLIMAEKLPIRLTVLIGAVENLVSNNAYKPGDIIKTRKGISIEIGNTDAEGRVVLSDLLAYAVEKNPKLIIDFATLTGAARIALGTDLPVLFCNRDDLAVSLQNTSLENNEPMWRLPLHQPYRELIETSIADISNNASSSYGGAITAALFLETFVDNLPWVHLDLMAWNVSSKPARPEGGEAMGLAGVFAWIRQFATYSFTGRP